MKRYEMINFFEEIFSEVMSELNVSAWYELFDSDDFTIVENRIASKLNVTLDRLYRSRTYNNWVTDMAMEL
jgi:hypothetical protein